jgi:hypothetical protein
VPGDVLLHPLAVAALVTLVANDHVLKAAWPGAVTGKLSDVAGLALTPLVLVAGWEVGRWALGRPWGPSRSAILGAVVATGLAFAAAKTLPPAADVYRVGLGVLQWPFAAVGALIGSGPLPELRPVAFVRDATDLVALPALLVPFVVGHRRGRRNDPDPQRPGQRDDRREHAEDT